MIREQSVGLMAVHSEEPAYRSGWEDGRFGSSQTLLSNDNLAGWTECWDRLAYYRGHRDGRRVREMLLDGERI